MFASSRKVIGNNHGSCIGIVPDDTEMAWIDRPSTSVGDLASTQSKSFCAACSDEIHHCFMCCNVLMSDEHRFFLNDQPHVLEGTPYTAA